MRTADQASRPVAIICGMEANGARRAVPGDAAEVTRLRLQMFRELGKTDDGWVDACVEALSEALGRDTPELAAFVVEGSAAGQLAACGVGYLERRLPGPAARSGIHGHIGSIYTEVQHRRRGHARAILRALLDWFWERDAERVQLWASDFSAPLFAAEGFYVGHPLWQLRRPPSRAEASDGRTGAPSLEGLHVARSRGRPDPPVNG